MAADADLKISMEAPAAWERRLTITVPAERVARERRATADRVSRRIRLPGFRKGKVPTAIVEKRFGPAIEQEAIEKVIGDAYREAVEQQGLQPITQGSIGRIDYQSGSDLTFDVDLEVRPEIELARLGGFVIEPTRPVVDDAEIDRVIERLRDEQAAWQPVSGEYPLIGDMVRVELTPQPDEGEPAPATRAYELVLGEGQSLPQIEDAIRTLTEGEENDFTVDLPVDPERPTGETKPHRLHIRLLDVRRPERPEVNDEFARSLGEFANLDELRARIRDDLGVEADREAERDVRRKLIAQILEANAFDVPASMLDQYVAGVLPAREGDDDERLQTLRTELRPAAETALRRLLVIQRVAEMESLSATESEVDARVDQIAERLGRPASEVKAQLRKNGRLAELEEEITEDKVFEYLKGLSTIKPASAA